MSDGGGGGGAPGDPLAGLQMPPGDPGPLDGIASQLSRWASSLGTGAAGHRQAASSVINSAWIGPDATKAGKSVADIAEGAATMGNAADDASSALRRCSSTWTDALSEWKKAQGLAKQALADEAAHRSAAAKAVAAMTPAQQTTDPSAYAQSQAASTGADGYTSPYRAQALQLGEDAVTKATTAITTASTHLSSVAGAVSVSATAPSAAEDGLIDELLNYDGAAGIPLTALGVGAQAVTADKVLVLMQSLRAGKYDQLAKVDPEAYEAVEKVLRTDPEDMAALNRAWFGYLQRITGDAFGDSARAAVPIDGLDGATSSLGKMLDVLGKAGLVTAAAGDVFTLVDPKSSDLDRAMTAANLAGVGMAATGTTAGASALAALGATDAVAATIPVAGEVVIAGTGLFLAGEFVYHNWGTISRWAGDAGSTIATGYDDANKWLTNAQDNVVHDGEHLAGAAVHEGEHLASGAVHDGEKLLSDINPF